MRYSVPFWKVRREMLKIFGSSFIFSIGFGTMSCAGFFQAGGVVVYHVDFRWRDTVVAEDFFFHEVAYCYYGV